MNSFDHIQSIKELKSRYHQQALICHPDCGGNTESMQKLILSYQQRKSILERYSMNFTQLQVGDIIYVNGTACSVILITRTKFVARAKGRSKQAWFNLETGIGIDFPYYKASFIP